MAQPADVRAVLPSRINELRRRAGSLGASAGDSLAALDRRVVRLAQRIQEGAWDAAADCQHFLPETLPGDAAPSQAPLAPGEYVARVRELLGRVAPLREQLATLARSDEFDDLPIQRTHLRKASEIAELADLMMRQAQSIQQQILMLPAWESMVRQADDRYAELAALARWRQRRRYEVATLREITCQLLAGARPRWEAIVELAGRILHDLEEEPQPEIFQPPSFDPPVVVATHSVNVAHLAGFLASGGDALRPHRLGAVVAALFADVGMLKAAPRVLVHGGGPLTEDERADIERHPLESAALVDRIAGFDPTLTKAIAQHHERLDRSGYPAACGGEQILPVARLLACADIYTALRSRRAHRPAWDPPTALTGTLAEADAGRIDEGVARGLLDLSLYPVGTIVELATSEIAQVIATQNAQADPTLAARPIVKLLTDRQGNPLPAPAYRNLANRMDSRIVRTVQAEELYLRRQSA